MMRQPTATTLSPLIRPKTMSDEIFRLLRSLIYDLTGIYFQDNKKYLLEGRLGKRLQLLGIETFEEYYRLVKYAPQGKAELRHLYEAVTINETYFFRNESQFQVFQDILVPELLARKRTGEKPLLRVWSAASSSGEEAYTIAMIYLERLKPRYPDLEIEILGTDINQAVLEQARRGVYREYSVRAMPPPYVERYLRHENQRYIVREDIRRLVQFDYLNLMDRSAIHHLRHFDVIFCCNVLIYFDHKSKVQVVSSLYDAMTRGGFLFIGHAETLHGISSAFKLLNFPKTVAYQKE
jgi:chemotaxis protein methyltransferase CheR